MQEQQEHMVKLANQKIYFGKHKGRFLLDLPESYLLWLKKQDIENQSFKMMIEEICMLKENGLEMLVEKFRQ